MHRPHLIALAATAALVVGGVAGCADDPKPPPRVATALTTASDATPRAAAPPQRMDTQSPTSGSVHIDQRILKACGDIPSAHFAFDSVAIQPDARFALDALARCFVSGPLAGRGMVLTGHTDPRGEVEYNIGLGQRRAGSVGSYLESRGMARAKVNATSRGEFDATGTDEEGWARDRKVDVTLAE